MAFPKFFRRRTILLEGELSHGFGTIFDRPCNATITAAGNASKQIVASGANGLLGCAVRESAAGVTAWRIRDGSVTGPILAVFGAPANSTGSPVLPPQGVTVLSGAIFLENVSGSGEVVVYWG